jgi:hypothetical protein
MTKKTVSIGAKPTNKTVPPEAIDKWVDNRTTDVEPEPEPELVPEP